MLVSTVSILLYIFRDNDCIVIQMYKFCWFLQAIWRHMYGSTTLFKEWCSVQTVTLATHRRRCLKSIVNSISLRALYSVTNVATMAPPSLPWPTTWSLTVTSKLITVNFVTTPLSRAVIWRRTWDGNTPRSCHCYRDVLQGRLNVEMNLWQLAP